MGDGSADWRSAPGSGSPASFLGRRLEYTYEVVELVPAERFVMRSDPSPFRMETTYTWQDAADGGTWMTLRNRGEPTAFAGLAAPILATAIRRATARIWPGSRRSWKALTSVLRLRLQRPRAVNLSQNASLLGSLGELGRTETRRSIT